MSPTTLKEAREYCYGKWAGWPKGQSYQEGYCIEEVFPGGRGEIHHQCGRKAKSPLNPFCHVHDPRHKVEQASKAANARALDEAVVARGRELLRRLGVLGYVPLHLTRYEHVQSVTISFQEVDRLLKELGK